MDSEIYPTVGWPFLRVWVEDDTVIDDMESYYEVPLKRYAVPIAGAYTPATATFTLQGSVTAGDAVGLATVVFAIVGVFVTTKGPESDLAVAAWALYTSN
jgi:hypothetical protein